MSDSARPHRWQATRLPRPWDSPGKNTGVGCHFLFQCMKLKSESEVAQSCLTLSDPVDCSLPGSSIHGIFQARVLGNQGPGAPGLGRQLHSQSVAPFVPRKHLPDRAFPGAVLPLGGRMCCAGFPCAREPAHDQ